LLKKSYIEVLKPVEVSYLRVKGELLKKRYIEVLKPVEMSYLRVKGSRVA
jgi:hypothetical protein